MKSKLLLVLYFVTLIYFISCDNNDQPITSWELDCAKVTKINDGSIDYISYVDGYALTAQGCAINEGYLYRFYDMGYCCSFKIHEDLYLSPVKEFKLSSFHDGNHVNCAQIDKTTGLLYSSELFERRCNVEKIDNIRGCSQLLQTISIKKSKLLGDGWLNIICGDDGFLWAFGYCNDDSKDFIFLKFSLPDLSKSEVSLGDEDVIDSWYLSDDLDMQGGTIHKGFLYCLSGSGKTNKRLLIFDTQTKNLSNIIDLNNIIKEEPEDCDFFNDYLVITVYGGSAYYVFEF